MSHLNLHVSLSAAALAIASSAMAETRYRVIDVGDFPGGYNKSAAYGISSDGRIAGYGTIANNRYHQLYWDASSGLVYIGTLGGQAGFSYAWGVNSSGSVVGHNLSNGALLATVWDATNGMRVLPGLASGGGIAAAYAVNDAGQVAGGSLTSTEFHAVLWNGFQTVQDLGVCDGDTTSRAYGIGPDGTVVGFSASTTEQAFVWTPVSGMVGIGQLEPGYDCEAWGVNAAGQVVGTSYGPTRRGFVWTQATGMVDLGDGPGGAIDLQAYSINASGTIVGSFSSALGSHGFVKLKNLPARDLNDLLAAGSESWTVLEAMAVNDREWIAASGKGGTVTMQHALLLKPVHTVAPDTLDVKYGRLAHGGVMDLAVEDNVAAQVCKFVVPNANAPIIRVEFQGTSPVAVPSLLNLHVRSRMANNGSFRQDLWLFDAVSAAYTDVRHDALGTAYASFDLQATEASRMVGGQGRLLAKLEIVRTGPSAVTAPCVDIDAVVWTVED